MFDLVKEKIRQWHVNFYHYAIRISRQQARLEKKKVAIDFGEIVFLSTQGAAFDAARPVMLLLHGFGSEKDTWVRFAEMLDVSFPLVIPDLPGHGESTWDRDQDYSIHSQTYRIHEMLMKLGVTSVHIIGHSMGGAIALRMAHLFPDLVRSLVLVSAAGAELKSGQFEAVVDFRQLNPLVDVQNKADFQRLLDMCMHKPPYLPRIAFNVLAEKKIARYDIDRRIFSDMVMDLDQSAYLGQLSLPVLVLWGSVDQVLSVEDAGYLQEKLRDSQLLILNGIGHVPMLEDPKQTSRAVNEFVCLLAYKRQDAS